MVSMGVTATHANQMTDVHFATWADIHCIIEDIFGEGDKVAIRWTWSGSHKGELMGIAPTGKRVTMTGISIMHIVDGKVAKEWTEMDTLGMMQQLDVIPSR